MDSKQSKIDKIFLGKGFAFPLNIDGEQIAMVEYEQDIRQAILIVLGTNPGERVMRPEFGAGLNDFIFEPINTTTMALIQKRVEEALIDWEPRIHVQQVKVIADTAENGKISIHIDYNICQTNTLYNLVYPFYLKEGAA